MTATQPKLGNLADPFFLWPYSPHHPAALRNTPKLTYLDASILPTTSLPNNVAFRLEHFVHDGLVIGLDAVNFFTEQSSIEHLILNPFSYYEVSRSSINHYFLVPSMYGSLTPCALLTKICLVTRGRRALSAITVHHPPQSPIRIMRLISSYPTRRITPLGTIRCSLETGLSRF